MLKRLASTPGQTVELGKITDHIVVGMDAYVEFLLIFKGPKSDSFTLLPKVYRGEHLPHPRVAEFRVKEALEVDADRPLPIEADGEVLVYSADTGPSEELVQLARGAQVLLSEATWLERPQWAEDIHLTAAQAGEHAARAGKRGVSAFREVRAPDVGSG